MTIKLASVTWENVTVKGIGSKRQGERRVFDIPGYLWSSNQQHLLYHPEIIDEDGSYSATEPIADYELNAPAIQLDNLLTMSLTATTFTPIETDTDLSFEQLCDLFKDMTKTCIIEKKDGVYMFNMAKYNDLPCRRISENVKYYTGIILDYDLHRYRDVVRDYFDKLGIQYIMCSTFSNETCKVNNKGERVSGVRQAFRVILPLSTPLSPGNFTAVNPILKELARCGGAVEVHDDTSLHQTHVFYLPCANESNKLDRFCHISNSDIIARLDTADLLDQAALREEIQRAKKEMAELRRTIKNAELEKRGIKPKDNWDNSAKLAEMYKSPACYYYKEYPCAILANAMKTLGYSEDEYIGVITKKMMKEKHAAWAAQKWRVAGGMKDDDIAKGYIVNSIKGLHRSDK